MARSENEKVVSAAFCACC